MKATEVGNGKDITKKTSARMEEEVSKGPVEGINSDNKVDVGVVSLQNWCIRSGDGVPELSY